MILGKKIFSLIRGLDLDFFGGKHFFDHVTILVPHTLFVILDILDIPDEFGVKKIFPSKRSGLRIISRTFFTTTCFQVFHIDFPHKNSLLVMFWLLPVTSGRIRYRAIELLDPENDELAVGTALLSSLEAEI